MQNKGIIILYPLKRIQKNGKDIINYVEYSNENSLSGDNFDIYELIKNFINLHQKRWRDKGKSGIFRQNNVRIYFIDLFKTLYESNLMHLSFLRYGNEDIAGALTFEYCNKRELYLISLNPDYSKLHPGILLVYFNIESAIKTALKKFDFLRGDEDYKKKFFAVKRVNFDIYLYKNKVYYYLFKADMLIKKLLTFFIEKISINIERIRKFKI